MTGSGRYSSRLVILAPAVGAALFLAALSTRTTADPDLWGHIRFGLDILASRQLPAVDPYSFTQDRPWINHEWLSEVGMGLAWTAGGTAGLALAKGALVSLALGLVWRGLRDISLSPRIVVFACAVTAAVPLARTFRPQVWTLLLVVVLCRVLADGALRSRWWLPLVFGLWANLHGGFIVGLGILASWTAGETLERRRFDRLRWAIAGLSALATTATPHGWELWRFVLATVRLGRDITEWQPIWNSAPADALLWLIAVAASVWWLRPRGPDWPRLLVLALLAYSSMRVVRVVPLFAVAAVVLLAASWRRAWPVRANRRVFDPSPFEPVAALVIFVVTVAGAARVLRPALQCIAVRSERFAEPRPVALLRAAPAGRLVTFFDWGEYAIWHLGPSIKVSMDGRRETIYTDARLREHAAILNGTPDGFARLSGWRPEYVWLPATSGSTREWLAGQGYRLEFSSTRSFLAVRSDLPMLGSATGASGLSPRCFPE